MEEVVDPPDIARAVLIVARGGVFLPAPARPDRDAGAAEFSSDGLAVDLEDCSDRGE
jgi:hypothetical protein